MNEIVKRESGEVDVSTWDYHASVERMRGVVYRWKSLTIELAGELWIAREELSHQGARTDLTSGQMTRSWETYCEAIGLEKRTANRWLERYDPVGQMLLEAPERMTRSDFRVLGIGKGDGEFREQQREVYERVKKVLPMQLEQGVELEESPESMYEGLGLQNRELQERTRILLEGESSQQDGDSICIRCWRGALLDAQWTDLFAQYYDAGCVELRPMFEGKQADDAVVGGQ